MNNKELTKKTQEIKEILNNHIEFGGEETPNYNRIVGYNELVATLADYITKTTQSNDEIKREILKVTGETSDGYHTFNELYAFRKVFNAGLFNEWSEKGLYKVHKSKKHSDGEECFGGGWFIVTATLPTGQISNHYELGDWDLFQCEEREKADVWDGHTPQDVLTRLTAYLTQKENNE